MKAAWYEHNGAARDVLEVGEMETPAPEAGQVRVRVHASGVNPSDVKSRKGRPPASPRIIPHSDGAGIIDAVGEGVNHGRIGERVWVWNGQWKRPFGTAAEHIVLPDDQAVRLDDDIDFAVGACFGIPALTAMHAVRMLGDIGGKSLLVTGAGSSVGHYAVQIAKARGARVLGTASGARGAHAREAGADFVIDYKAKDVAETVKGLTGGKGVDGIVDMDLSTTADLIPKGVLAAHGTHVCYGSNYSGDIPISFSAMLWNSITLKVFVVYELTAAQHIRAIAELNELLVTEALDHAIGERFRLDDIVAAHEAVEGGKVVGNVVIEMA